MDTFKIQLGWTDMTDRSLTRRTIIFAIQLDPPPTRVEKRHLACKRKTMKCRTRVVLHQHNYA